MSQPVSPIRPEGVKMTRTQALKEAKRLRKEGIDSAEIAKRLASAGFRSSKHGGPLSASGINHMLVKAGVRRYGVKRKQVASSPKERRPLKSKRKDIVEVAKGILNLKMNSDEKLALLSLVLE